MLEWRSVLNSNTLPSLVQWYMEDCTSVLENNIFVWFSTLLGSKGHWKLLHLLVKRHKSLTVSFSLCMYVSKCVRWLPPPHVVAELEILLQHRKKALKHTLLIVMGGSSISYGTQPTPRKSRNTLALNCKRGIKMYTEKCVKYKVWKFIQVCLVCAIL